MDYVLVTFQQRNNVRQYAFRGTTPETQRMEFLVEVDISLLLQHRIPLQEIPLLCRRLLEARPASEQHRQLTFTPALMRDYAARRDAEKAIQRR